MAQEKEFSLFRDVFNSDLDKLLLVIDAATNDKDRAKAYSDSYNKAKGAVTDKVTAKLTDDQVLWSSKGLEIQHDVDTRDVHVTDILNSVMASWDKSAAKFMRGKHEDGMKGRNDLVNRLHDFDISIISQGGTPVKKDE